MEYCCCFLFNSFFAVQKLRLLIVVVVDVLVVVFLRIEKTAKLSCRCDSSLIPCESCTRRCSLYRSGPDELAKKTSFRGRKRELPKLYTGGGSWLMPYVFQQVQRWPDLKSSYQH